MRLLERMNLKKIEDKELIALAAKGNNKAFDEFMSRHRMRVFRIACSMVSDEEDAMDMAQESFVKAYKSLRRFRGDCSPKTWIDRIIINTCVDWQRKQKTRRRLFAVTAGGDEEGPGLEGRAIDDSWDTDPIHVIDDKRVQAVVGDVLSILPEKQRAAFILRHREGYSIHEISEILVCAEGTAKVHLHRATQRMRDALKPYIAVGQ